MDKSRYNVHDEIRGRDSVEDDWKQGHTPKTSSNFYKLSSIIERTAGPTNLVDVVCSFLVLHVECVC